MASISRSALVMYTPEQMFNLVDDVDAYSAFLPWCKASVVHQRSEDEIEATVTLSKGAVNKSFTTRNRMQKNKMIEMQLVDGPFKHLHGFWRFEALKEGQACKVMLDLDFEFSNRILAMAIGPIFNQVANSLVDAFCQRAKQVYGD